MEKYLSIGKTAKQLGVSISTLRLWEKKGILIPERTPTGHRRYKLTHIKGFEVKKYDHIEQFALIYVRSQ